MEGWREPGRDGVGWIVGGAAVCVAMVLAAASSAGAAPRLPAHLSATLPAPVARADAADTDGALDVRAVTFGQVGHRFRLRIQLGAAVPVAGLAVADPARSICLDVAQPAPGRTQRLCLRVSPGHRLTLVAMRRGTDGSYGAPTALRAVVRRAGSDG